MTPVNYKLHNCSIYRLDTVFDVSIELPSLASRLGVESGLRD